jgi:ERCC4-type nuclease
MQILIDTREGDPLTFQMIQGIDVKSECLPTGDYACRHKNGEMDEALIERKSISDLFSSFTGDRYEKEKAKIARAKEASKRLILAIEGTLFEVRKGHSYTKGGETHESKKSGIAQIRQIFTLLRRGDYKEVWWCASRSEMAFMIQEYFLTQERIWESKEKLPKKT